MQQCWLSREFQLADWIDLYQNKKVNEEIKLRYLDPITRTNHKSLMNMRFLHNETHVIAALSDADDFLYITPDEMISRYFKEGGSFPLFKDTEMAITEQTAYQRQLTILPVSLSKGKNEKKNLEFFSILEDALLDNKLWDKEAIRYLVQHYWS